MFKLDLDKIKKLPNFDKATSHNMKEQYESDAQLEDHSVFEPIIPISERSKIDESRRN